MAFALALDTFLAGASFFIRFEGAEAAFAAGFFASAALAGFFAGAAATLGFFAVAGFTAGFFAVLGAAALTGFSAFSLGAFSPAGCAFYRTVMRPATSDEEYRTYLVGSRFVLGGKLDLARRSLGKDEDAILLTGGDSPVEMRCIRGVVLEVKLVLLADVLYQSW